MHSDTAVIILGAALAVSEALALIPSVKSNGIFHFVVNTVKALYDSLKK